MKIEEGKFYKDAEGRKVGPFYEVLGQWEWHESNGLLRGNGTSIGGYDPDLIEEWQDDPVQDYIGKQLAEVAVMLINANRYEDAISILYILKGDHE